MIIGLTGRIGSGKGEVAKFLQECGFGYYSLSDVIREVIRKKGLEVTRERLIAEGNRLRENNGPGILAEKTLEKLTFDKNYVVDSIRNPREVAVLKKRKDFFLLNIRAPRKIRFERVKSRKRENDPQTYHDFVQTEEKEFSSKNPASQQLLATEKLSDKILDNNGHLEGLHTKIRKTLSELSKKKSRPDWDAYFIEIARTVALRSNCMKRRVAAVIVKDKRIISTGYNGTPRGVKNCNEGGCPRCNSFGPSGKGLEECFCSHAEENAITQSAYHGVNIKGSTLYTTFSPCLICTKMIINSGISEVVYNAHYPLVQIATKLLKEAGVKTRLF
ncbi:MAG: dephospho-CoA kinase [Deltaproteobacteria bacterium]|nr:dephospho-CoA kinase [Deltaproteobacteria bacterium]MBI4197062.1 dephospho-CoA kinase [Deltaproteobacteria bacterium]